MSRYIVVLIMFGCFAASHLHLPDAHACQICVPYPEKTLADRLLEQDEIIFAREVPDTPYVFYQTEVIKGSGVTEPFKMFCNSTTRRKLRTLPDSAVVLVRKQNDSWRLITFADAGFLSFIRTLVSISGGWPGLSSNQERLHFFSKLFNSEDPQIHEQAYMEVGRAPYSMIKDLAAEIPRKQIYDLLRNYRLLEWHNLYILMLGQSLEAKDLEYLRDKVQSAARFGSTRNLAAWVTTFIESHPDSGVDEIERMYFMSENRTNEEIEQVMDSMSVLGSQTASSDLKNFKLRSRIIRSYSKLLENYPEMVAYVSKDLAAWRVQVYVDQISEIRENLEILDASSLYLVDYYLSAAPSFRRIGSLEKSDTSPINRP